jgi:hypothetical protein
MHLLLLYLTIKKTTEFNEDVIITNNLGMFNFLKKIFYIKLYF